MKHKDETITTLYTRGVKVETKEELEKLSKKYGYSVAHFIDEAVKELKRALRKAS